MKKHIITFFILILCGCFSTTTQNIELIELQISKSAIPEGIVVHPESKEIFLSSVHEDCITKSSKDGRTNKIILAKENNGYSIGVGMDIWNNKLYALSKHNRSHQSILSIIDLKSGNISTIKSFNVDTTYFNDLAIDKRGNGYITDTDNHNIYFYNAQTNDIDIFLNNEMIKYPNGITISDDNSKLFIDSWTTGIKIVDIANKHIFNKKHISTSKKGIDGLKYHYGHLYYIRNGGKNAEETHGLYRIKLLNNETILSDPVPLLVNHEKMHLPTTLSIVKDDIYILANSQLDKLVQEEHKIVNPDSLTNTYVIKYKIIDSDK